MTNKVSKTDAEWEHCLSPHAFQVLRQKGTEQAFTGDYWNLHDKGVYKCAGCGAALFGSDTKFDSCTGWPSYFAPISKESVKTITDSSHGMVRTEVVCGACGGHLGHVFDDGPKQTGLRFCINSAALKFDKEKAK